jgi:Sugar (and other) transporter
MANSLATASTAPFAGTISDLFGRRSVALFGAGVVIIGSIVTGCAWRVEVAIAGMALVGMGGGLSEVVAAAAVAEMAPVKNRGKYMGTAFLFVLPFGASSVYGKQPFFMDILRFARLRFRGGRKGVVKGRISALLLQLSRLWTNPSSTLFNAGNLAMGRLDLSYHCRD